MEQLPKTVRERLQAATPIGAHPDPNLLSAFVERTLGDRERGAILNHLASCADCRDVVALAAPLPDAAILSPEPKSVFRWPVLRWASVAAGIVVVAGAVGLYRVHAPSHTPTQVAVKVAESASAKPGATAPFLKPKSEEPTSQFSVPAASAIAAKPAAPQSPAEKRDELAFAKPVPSPMRAESENEKKEEPKHKLEVAPAADASVAETRTDELDDKVAQNQPSSDTYAARAKDGRSAVATPSSGAVGNLMAKQAGAQPNLVTTRKAQALPRWALTSDGTLERSIDSGKSWTPIVVSDGMRFQAV